MVSAKYASTKGTTRTSTATFLQTKKHHEVDERQEDGDVNERIRMWWCGPESLRTRSKPMGLCAHCWSGVANRADEMLSTRLINHIALIRYWDEQGETSSPAIDDDSMYRS